MNNKTKRVFGRKTGRPLNASRKAVMENTYPRLVIDDTALKEDEALAPSSLFDVQYKECWFEIGFGTGEHLSALMRRHPDNAYIGAEPFVNGMAAFLKDITNDPHDRIAVHMDDAMMVANSLSDNCLDGIYILNPDPWHKTRHHKRRIVNRDNLGAFARTLKPNAPLIMSTDVPYLAEWMITEVMLHGGFEWEAGKAADWQTPPDDWISTVYEKKGAKGAGGMVYLFFRNES